MILVYTGNGKGKTSASVGQGIRALGQGLSVGFAQFIKRPEQAGEQHILSSLLGAKFRAGGLGFLRKAEDFPPQRKAALELLDWATRLDVQMLILDEAIYALGLKLLQRDELEGLLRARAADPALHLVLSGRDAPPWLVEAADLVTEMRECKHPWQKGISAIKGIEF